LIGKENHADFLGHNKSLNANAVLTDKDPFMITNRLVQSSQCGCLDAPISGLVSLDSVKLRLPHSRHRNINNRSERKRLFTLSLA
jgi:hypothetical protein